MAKKIFNNIVMLSTTVLLVLVTITLLALGNYLNKLTRDELKYNADIIAQGFNRNFLREHNEKGLTYKDEQEYFKLIPSADKRITVVNPDGTVVFDGDADATEMENHSDRPEIKSAIRTGTGISQRYSKTLSLVTIYYAVKLDNGQILRLAITKNSVITVFYNMSIIIVFLTLVILVVAVVMAEKLAERIVEPINNMDFDNPYLGEGYEELDPLIRRLKTQQEVLKNKENEILNQKKELENIIKNLTEGFILIDNYENIISINESALNLLGYMGESKPEKLMEISRIPAINDAVQSAYLGEKRELELKIQKRDAYIMVSPMLNYNKEVIGAMINVVDITDIVQREELRREFTANVSHELKTPLTSISGYAEIMKDGMVPSEDMPAFSEKIYNEAQKLISLVKDILTLSALDEKQDENAMEITKEKQSLTDVLKQVKEDLKFKADSMEVEIISDLKEEVSVNAKMESLYRIAYNLIENAIKYNKKGGYVLIKTFKDSKGCGFVVKDNGIGIDKQEQNRIFERFYRVDKGRTGTVEGTGLGLSIVKKDILLTGAGLKLDSIPGEGTEVEVSWK